MKKFLLLLVPASVLMALALASCASPVPNRVPVGDPFPRVSGKSLAGDEVELPGEFAGAPVVLLVGYVQDTQFDIDRWLLGILDLGLDVRFAEVPTIENLIPSLISGTIDEGMRSGIPSEDWSGVITLYGGDADEVVELTGDERPRSARVLLLDTEGLVVWFHDRGYSPRVLLELRDKLDELR